MAAAWLPSCMRAVLLRSFGGPEVLSLARAVVVPHAGAHDVLVRVSAVGVNPLDCRVRFTTRVMCNACLPAC